MFNFISFGRLVIKLPVNVPNESVLYNAFGVVIVGGEEVNAMTAVVSISEEEDVVAVESI